MASDTQINTADSTAPIAPAPKASRPKVKRTPAPKTAPQGVKLSEWGGVLGIGGPNGTPVYAGERLLSARVTVAPVADSAGMVTGLTVTIPGVERVTLPFKGAETVRYVAGLFRKHNLRAEGRRNRSDSSQMADGLLPALAGGNPGIWTGRRNGSGVSTPASTLSDADLAGLLLDRASGGLGLSKARTKRIIAKS